MRVLVTGGAGYIGSTITRLLTEKGHTVICLDRLFFGLEPLAGVMNSPRFQLLKDDIRWFDPSILRNVDAVIDLAALSNDPAGELDPSKTLDINFSGRVRVAKLSKEYGVKHYVVSSSCSVYGFQEGILREDSPLNPLTTYAKANVLAEKAVLPLSDSTFSVTVLRPATVFGFSHRMRFDLAINGIVLGLYKTGKIPVMRDGTQWRPFVHVADVANAFIKIIETSDNSVNKEVFNVGSNDLNFQILSLAEHIGESIGVPYQIDWYGTPDNRSYKVSFHKIERLGFETKYSVREGALEIYQLLTQNKLTDSLKTRTVEWYKHLLEAHRVSSEVTLRGTIL